MSPERWSSGHASDMVGKAVQDPLPFIALLTDARRRVSAKDLMQSDAAAFVFSEVALSV